MRARVEQGSVALPTSDGGLWQHVAKTYAQRFVKISSEALEPATALACGLK